MIVLTGATGTIGSSLVEQLTQKGTKFRVVARHPDKVKKAPNVEVVQGSYDEMGTLESAFKGATRVFALTNSVPESVQWHKNIVDAAKKSGVKHVVRLSVIGADKSSPVKLAAWHWECDEHLKASGLTWTILQPTYFMQNFMGGIPTIKKDGAFYGAGQHGKIAAIDARDIAAVALKTLTEDQHAGKTYPLTGNQPITQSEFAERVSKVVGKPVKYVDLPPAQFKAGLTSAGLADWYAQDFVTMHQFISQGGMAQVDPTTGQLLGRVRSWDDFFAAYGGAFK
jgi:uncharacterized protein YbjT (DUF2867 family)